MEIQKLNSAALKFANQPEEFLTQLGCFMETIQQAYRSRLADAEQILWRDTLCHSPEQFTMHEVNDAMKDLIEHPPLQRIEGGDGWITQPYIGIPKLPDFIYRMLARREDLAEQARRGNAERAPDPSCSDCGGVGWKSTGKGVRKCHCWAMRRKLTALHALPPAEEDRKTLRDVLKTVADKLPDARIETIGKPMPEAPVSVVLQSDELANRRREQMKRDFKDRKMAAAGDDEETIQ